VNPGAAFGRDDRRNLTHRPPDCLTKILAFSPDGRPLWRTLPPANRLWWRPLMARKALMAHTFFRTDRQGQPLLAEESLGGTRVCVRLKTPRHQPGDQAISRQPGAISSALRAVHTQHGCGGLGQQAGEVFAGMQPVILPGNIDKRPTISAQYLRRSMPALRPNSISAPSCRAPLFY
jgi:hypothetical protein